jgi:hypothetical protein
MRDMNTTNESVLGYSNFNRHEYMDRETLFEIGDIIAEVRFEGGFDLTNMLYGLYDGYLYDELLPLAESKLDSNLSARIENVINIVSKYPKL